MKERYIPALSFDWLTPFYDFLARVGVQDLRQKRFLVSRADIRPGQRVLDVGCGTATLTILIAQTYPQAEVVGLDGDARILGIARKKALAAGVQITFDQGMADALPYAPASFDRVVSSLVFHHLGTQNKLRAFQEIWRILRPGGELHLLDFGQPHNGPARLLGAIVRHWERAEDNVQGRLPALMREAGLEEVEEYACRLTLFGTLSFYRARKPG